MRVPLLTNQESECKRENLYRIAASASVFILIVVVVLVVVVYIFVLLSEKV